MFLAIAAAAIVVWMEYRRRGWEEDDVTGTMIVAVVGGFFGARMLSGLFHWSSFASDPVGFLLSPTAGLVFYGALIGATLFVVGYIRWKGYPVLEVADVAALAVPLAYAVGRIGCFLAGDDYGIPTDLPWAMAFPEGAPPTTRSVHPTQLYEAAGGLMIFGLVWSRRMSGRSAGSLAGLTLTLMGVERFLVEFLRRNPEVALGWTLAQWFSIGLILLGSALVLHRGGRGRKAWARA